MTTVAVIIVTWNATELLGQVLDALDAQTLKPCRVLVVDNGSADAERLEAVLDGRQGHTLIRLSENQGFAAANNLAIARCNDVEYVALLNPDAFPDPQWLKALTDAACANPYAASFASRMLDHGDTRMLDGAGDVLSISGKPARRGHGDVARARFLAEEDVFAPCAAAALYRRSAFVECGGFDEQFFCYLEDVDLGFRLRLAGHGCLYVPAAVVRHIGSALTGRRSDFAVYHGHRNIVFNFIKNMPSGLFWLLLPLHLLMNFAYLAGAICSGQTTVMLRAKRDAFRALPMMWAKRAIIQRSRRASVRSVWAALDKTPFPGMSFRINRPGGR
ncbi:glycosyltransferase family 2 protein [Methyloversatilis sp.]|uniref:glycosyltransferase family 2 protein n=1 Tax=Methyloversatilis sp. TaxID=2569862 RepID=UPI003D298ACB